MMVDCVSGAIVNVTDPGAGSGPIIAYYRVTDGLARVESSRDDRLAGLVCAAGELGERVQERLSARPTPSKPEPL